MSIDDVADITPISGPYSASAAQTAFDYDFPIFADSDLKVYVDGTLKTLTTHYTVSGAQEEDGGTVTFVTPMVGGEVVVIYRDTAIERLSDFQTSGPRTAAAMNDELDRITLIQQEFERNLGRAIRLPIIAEQPSSELELSGVSWEAKYLFINSDGELEPNEGSFSGSHASLSGLGDDDHTQYFNMTRGDARYSLLAHTHDYAATSHAHAASDITSGTMATARLGSGTANDTKYLRGDSTWATPGGVGGGVTDHGDLTGLADDDHPQYALVASVETISAAWNFTTAPQITSIELGHASDTTLARVAAGRISVEGAELARLSASGAFTQAMQFTTIELGHATQNTLSGSGGVLSIEGHAVPTVDQAQTISAVYDFTAQPTMSGVNIGFREIPQNIQNGNYTAVAADNGKHIFKASGASGETITIPANASVAYPIGTTLTVVNMGGGTLSIAITSDTLTWAEDGTTGTRTLANNGIATALKVTSTGWLISGTGLT